MSILPAHDFVFYCFKGKIELGDSQALQLSSDLRVSLRFLRSSTRFSVFLDKLIEALFKRFSTLPLLLKFRLVSRFCFLLFDTRELFQGLADEVANIHWA